jgi:glycosyltransferase involved in cell wall biosynthesis
MRAKLCILIPAHSEALLGESQYQAKVLVDYLLEHYDVDIAYLTTCDVVRLYRALARERPDIILQFVGSAHTGIAALYARLHGCKMLWRVTSDRSVEPQNASWLRPHRHLARLFLDFGIRNATLILAETEYQRARLAARFPRAPVQVLPSFHPAAPDSGRNDAVVRQVAWIGSLNPSQNPGAFIALARRFEARNDVRFVLVGDRLENGAWTTEQLAAIAATPNLEYCSASSQAEVNTVLEHSDLLVNTSDYESFPNIFIRAWMRRIPIVSLRVDPDRLLSRGGLGAVTGTEDALHDRVANLLDEHQDARATA